MNQLIPTVFIFILSFSSFPLLAESQENQAIYFTAPPRENAEKGIRIYKPIADFLSKKLGRAVVYQQPVNWAQYWQDMSKDKLHIVFDGPHLIQFRKRKLNHVPVARLPQDHIWVIIRDKKNAAIEKLSHIQGKAFCGLQFPNYGTLTALEHFDFTREPNVKIKKGWKDVFNGVINGDCLAGILPLTNLVKFDPKHTAVEVIHTHPANPNQGFTVSARFKPALILEIQNALLSDEGHIATTNLRARFSNNERLIKPKLDEYEGLDSVLSHKHRFHTATPFNQQQALQQQR